MAQYPVVGATRLSLAGIKTFRGMEGEGLNAKVYFDGLYVGDVLDEGHGGCMVFQMPVSTKNRIDQYISSLDLPLIQGQLDKVPYAYPQDAETLINRTVDAYMLKKKLQQYWRTKALFTLPGDPEDTYRTVAHRGNIPATKAYILAKYPHATIHEP